MKFFHFFNKRKLADWIVRNAEGPQSAVLLSSVAFAEAVFFPIPPDIILIAILASQKVPKWIRYSAITTVASVVGGIGGYMVGSLFFDLFGQAIIDFYNLENAFAQIAVIFRNNSFWAVFISAFTPIPFKVFTISSGLFKINFFVFLVAAFFGRALRFFFVGFLMKLYGHRLAKSIYRNFNFVSIAILVAIIVLILVFV